MKVADDILTLKSSIMMPLMRFPVTSTAIRTSRGVVLIAPGKNIPAQEAEIESFGRVTDIVAPNLLHHLSLHQAQKTFPQATIWGVPGFKEKRPDVQWDKFLTSETWAYNDEIKIIKIQGVPKLNECVFFHVKSKTLIVTDLFFNLLDVRGIRAWIVMKLVGTYRKFGISSLYMRTVEDKAAFKNSLHEIAKCDFKNIVMSHGTPVTENARALFNTALKERELQ